NATNRNVTWSSSNEAVASVDDKGEVTAHKAGEATVTVTTVDGAKTASVQIKVTAAAVPPPPVTSVTGVSLNKSSLTLPVGGKEVLTATVAPHNATNRNVTWSSSNEAVASVDDKGEVTA
ncbi:Ig-like domain-containing protein, partial [Tannerella forsythia]|uniref:Ig-like domain-containing protein n=1 Tax=Tannerella forsythia TaxID=28112 RepID=UPI000BE74AB8